MTTSNTTPAASAAPTPHSGQRPWSSRGTSVSVSAGVRSTSTVRKDVGVSVGSGVSVGAGVRDEAGGGEARRRRRAIGDVGPGGGQGLVHLLHGGVPIGLRLGRRLRDHPVQRRRHRRVARARPRRRLLMCITSMSPQPRGGERRLPAQHLEQDEAERVDVGLR